MFRFRLYTPLGDDEGEVQLAISTLQPGETVFTDDGRKLFVLDAVYPLPAQSDVRGFLTVDELPH